MPKPIAYAVTFLVCLLLQVGIAPAIAIGGATPNFLLIPVVLVSLKSGYTQGSIAGFACGLFEDFAGVGTIGCMALTLTLTGVVVGLVGSVVEVHSPLISCVIVLCACLFAEFGYGISVLLSNVENGGVLATMLGFALPSALYSAIFGCIALVTINLVMADEAPARGGFSGGSLGSRTPRMPRMKSRLK